MSREDAKRLFRTPHGEGGEAHVPRAEDPGPPDEPTRRTFLKLLGATAATATSACAREPIEKILPYARRPPEVTPGVPSWYATSLVTDGYAMGVLVESHTGRPTKVEGNPDHPASLGATTAREQASLFGLYDAARVRSVLERGAPAATELLDRRLSRDRSDRGEGLRFVLEATSSPLVAALAMRILERFPRARFTFHSPARPPSAIDGAELAFGRRLETVHDLSGVEVVLSIDADFVSMPFGVRYARQLADARLVREPGSKMARLYAVEPALSTAGALADHRLALPAGEMGRFTAALAAELAAQGGEAPGKDAIVAALAPLSAHPNAAWIAALARDLLRAGPRAAVLVGDRQPPEVHALAHLVRALCGAKTARAIAPVVVEEMLPRHRLHELAAELTTGTVDTLVVLDSNVVYSAPGELDFGSLARAVAESVYLGQHLDETASVSRWVVPAAHELETWGDARAADGTLSLVQPLVSPLFAGRTATELLALFAGIERPSAYRLLRERFLGSPDPTTGAGSPAREDQWRTALATGVVAGTEAVHVRASLEPAGLLRAIHAIARVPPAPPDSIEIDFAPDPSVHDGKLANDARLQELPKPHTKLTWSNAALVSPSLASRLGLRQGDVVRLAAGERSVEAPVVVAPGHAAGSVTVHLGYGRDGALPVAKGLGFSAYLVRSSASPGFVRGASIARTDRTEHLAITQPTMDQRGRDIARTTTARAYAEDPRAIAPERGRAQPSLLRMAPASRPSTDVPQWAMSVDLGACIGCNACVIACQVENNVPVVGPEGVRRNRAMHWLRIDTYFDGEAEAPRVVHQPMLCQHCERAPCEYPCPVNATVHSPDGLNEMVYNRCVGTRACANNCPYKVRRFNWFDFGEERPRDNAGLVELAYNPDVTVRERGVMEKCTFCVQRIRQAEIRARVERRPLRPEEVQTACQQACPTRVFSFGSIGDPDGRVTLDRAQPRAYQVLSEQGTLPRVTYLARIDDPNPEVDDT